MELQVIDNDVYTLLILLCLSCLFPCMKLLSKLSKTVNKLVTVVSKGNIFHHFNVPLGQLSCHSQLSGFHEVIKL